MRLEFPLCFEWVKGIGLDYKNINPLSAIEQLRDLSIQDRGLSCIKPHTPSLFPKTSNCFSFEHRWILKSIPAIRIQVGLLGVECNILNPYELGKCPLACCVSGSRLENWTTACVVLLKWVFVIHSNNIISSYRGYFVEYLVTYDGHGTKISGRVIWKGNTPVIDGSLQVTHCFRSSVCHALPQRIMKRLVSLRKLDKAHSASFTLTFARNLPLLVIYSIQRI
jgi:hypothetical protein